jgi:4-carboxymuconolactone decarboxylase
MVRVMAPAQERFPPLQPDQMSPEQQQVANAIASGPRGGLAGPFNAWLRSPELADRLQLVGEYVRFNSSIPHKLNELAILITARALSAEFEWWAHYQIAMKAGLDPAIAEAIAAGRRPERLSEDERIVYDFCTELLNRKSVGDATFQVASARFGEQGVIDLIGVSGYYATVAMTLNVARVPVPPGTGVPPLGPAAG